MACEYICEPLNFKHYTSVDIHVDVCKWKVSELLQ
jgi:hypothetical protein